MKHYKKSHWNVLDAYERAGTMAMLRNYKNKAEKELKEKEIVSGKSRKPTHRKKQIKRRNNDHLS
jgi:hypothetical protein